MKFYKKTNGSWKLGRHESLSSGKCELFEELDGSYSIRLLSSNLRPLFTGAISDLVRSNGIPYASLEDLETECGDFFVNAAQGAAESLTALTGRVEDLEGHAYEFFGMDYWTSNHPNPAGLPNERYLYDPATVSILMTFGGAWLEVHGPNTTALSEKVFYVDRQTGIIYSYSGTAMTPSGAPLVYVSQAEVESDNPTENTKVATILRVFQGFKYWLANVNFAALTTTAKTVLGAIVELKSLVDLRATIAGLFNYPVRTLALPAFDIDMTAAEDFTKLTGMGNNQAFTISNPILKKKCRLYLTGGTLAVPTFTGYTTTWMASTAVTDYVPANVNILYFEVRAAGTLNLFWGE